MTDEKEHKPLDYNYITDGIYIGTNQCCTTHFDERLTKEGIEADVSVEDERLDQPYGVSFYTWIPVKNHTAPTQEQLQMGINILENLVKSGKKTYLHCKNGHGRAPTMMAAYLMKTKGMTPEKAEAFIKERRPSIHLEDVQRKSLQEFATKK